MRKINNMSDDELWSYIESKETQTQKEKPTQKKTSIKEEDKEFYELLKTIKPHNISKSIEDEDFGESDGVVGLIETTS